MKTNTIQKKLNITLFFILFNHILNCNSFCNEKKNVLTYKNDYFEKNSLYQKCNENYCKFIKKFSQEKILIQKNKKKYLFTDQCSLSQIEINNNFLNFRNTYLKDYNQLIFHQLSYQFINKQKICNFGFGYRKHHCTQWIIGNNIFYDILLSSSKYDKKILSIGTEFLKNSMHITINTYYNIFNNNSSFVNKKYLPFSYDIYIKNRLPFFTNTHAKINMEHFFNNKHNKQTTFPQETNIIKKYPFNKNPYKLTLGLIYIPTSIFTFNIDKIISHSIKNHETRFNIVANYKIYIPWITPQKKEKINNDQCHINSYEKTKEKNNNEYTIYRNHTMLLLYPLLNMNIDNIQTESINQEYKQNKKMETCEPKKIYNSTKNNHDFHNLNNKNDIIPNTIKTAYDIKKESSNNSNKTSYSNTESPMCSRLNKSTQILSSDEKNTTDIQNTSIFINVNDNKLSSDNFPTNDIHHKNQISLIQIDNPDISSSIQKLDLQTKEMAEIQKRKSQNIDNSPNNIPVPPPMRFEPLSNNNVHSKQNVNVNDHTNNDSNPLNNLKTSILNIHTRKTDKFSSLGSEEHLLKLNSITIKKRTKTISTSSNDSNDSESIRLLRIIERQSILAKSSDTDDNEDKDSILSDNDFSE